MPSHGNQSPPTILVQQSSPAALPHQSILSSANFFQQSPTSRHLNADSLARRTILLPQHNLRPILLFQNSNYPNRYISTPSTRVSGDIPSIPPLLLVLRSALSQTRCFPEGSCQLILVSLVHLASSADNGVFERILEPFVGFEEDMKVRWTAGWRRLSRSDRREDGAMANNKRGGTGVCVIEIIDAPNPPRCDTVEQDMNSTFHSS